MSKTDDPMDVGAGEETIEARPHLCLVGDWVALYLKPEFIRGWKQPAFFVLTNSEAKALVATVVAALRDAGVEGGEDRWVCRGCAEIETKHESGALPPGWRLLPPRPGAEPSAEHCPQCIPTTTINLSPSLRPDG